MVAVDSRTAAPAGVVTTDVLVGRHILLGAQMALADPLSKDGTPPTLSRLFPTANQLPSDICATTVSVATRLCARLQARCPTTHY